MLVLLWVIRHNIPITDVHSHQLLLHTSLLSLRVVEEKDIPRVRVLITHLVEADVTLYLCEWSSY